MFLRKGFRFSRFIKTLGNGRLDCLAAWKAPSKAGGWWLSIGRAQLSSLELSL